MIPRDAAPIGNDPPLKRIRIGSDIVKPADQRTVREAAGDYSKAEADRIWRHVVTSASGAVTPPDAPSPAEVDEIDFSGLCFGV